MTLFVWMGRFSAALERPFSVRWTPHTIKFMLAALAAYDDYRKDYKRNRLHPERYNGWDY